MEVRRGWAWLVLAASVSAIIANFCAEYFRVFGTDMREVSDTWHTYLTPAGPAFSIWSLIYIGTLGLSVWQLLPAQLDDALLQRIRPWLVGAGVCNGLFPYLFHAGLIAASWGAVAGLLVCLIPAFSLGEARIARTFAERIWLQVVVGIYLGWVMAAFTVATAQMLAATGVWALEGSHVYMMATIALGLILVAGTWLTWHHVEPFPALTIAWATYWISVEQPAPLDFAALSVSIILAALGLLQFLRKRPTGMPVGSLV